MQERFFQIFKVTDDESTPKSDMPQEGFVAHDFEEIMVVLNGQAEHFIDFESFILAAPLVSYIPKGKQHRTIPLKTGVVTQAWLIRFDTTFILETASLLYLRDGYYKSMAFDSEKDFQQIVMMCEIMHLESNKSVVDYQVIRLLLNTFFAMLESKRPKENRVASQVLDARKKVFLHFSEILEANFREQHEVDFYAKKINMSSRNLNNICHEMAQKSISELIDERRIMEAKNMLISSDKNISEIGFELGYQEKSYFSVAFKKKVGVPPSEFKNQMKKYFS